ncbi:MAG: hypothetical protein JXR86_02135, partial [Spirochaetales bacterium]|nr:hypothetical protein [Spirochaetales bacterium]
MIINEYLEFNTDGPIQVQVKFPRRENEKKTIPKIKIHPEDLLLFFNPETKEMHKEMLFDGHPYSISKIELIPEKNKVIIRTEE